MHSADADTNVGYYNCQIIKPVKNAWLPFHYSVNYGQPNRYRQVYEKERPEFSFVSTPIKNRIFP